MADLVPLKKVKFSSEKTDSKFFIKKVTKITKTRTEKRKLKFQVDTCYSLRVASSLDLKDAISSETCLKFYALKRTDSNAMTLQQFGQGKYFFSRFYKLTNVFRIL